jgi:hypothetical protein
LGWSKRADLHCLRFVREKDDQKDGEKLLGSAEIYGRDDSFEIKSFADILNPDLGAGYEHESVMILDKNIHAL